MEGWETPGLHAASLRLNPTLGICLFVARVIASEDDGNYLAELCCE